MSKFEYPITVYPADTDFAGVMFHGKYLDYFDCARVAWFRQCGVNLADWSKQNIFFPVAHIAIDYLRPAFFNDHCVVECEIAELGRTKIVFLHRLLKAGKVIARATVKVGCVGPGVRPIRIPIEIREKIT